MRTTIALTILLSAYTSSLSKVLRASTLGLSMGSTATRSLQSAKLPVCPPLAAAHAAATRGRADDGKENESRHQDEASGEGSEQKHAGARLARLLDDDRGRLRRRVGALARDRLIDGRTFGWLCRIVFGHDQLSGVSPGGGVSGSVVCSAPPAFARSSSVSGSTSRVVSPILRS